MLTRRVRLSMAVLRVIDMGALIIGCALFALMGDGPFAETTEVIGGFALIQVNSKQEAIEWTKRFIGIVGDGESEIRQLCEEPAFQA